MKAILINNSNALLLNVNCIDRTDYNDSMTLKLDVNPLIELTTSNNTLLIDISDKDREDEVAYSIAEALVGPGGQITNYKPKENKSIKKHLSKK